MLKAAVELARHAVNLVYPGSCLICDAWEGESASVRHGLCCKCYLAVTTDPFPVCPWCAQTVGPYADTTSGCGDCSGAGFGFDRTVRLGPYAGQLRDAVLRIKLLAGEGLADQLGRAFADVRSGDLVGAAIALVVPIPLRWWRKWARGYNQSEAIAREIAAGLKVPLGARVLRRVRGTTQQAQSTRAARMRNMKGAFRVGPGARLAGRTVLLVDDVMTTGSTASEAAHTLLAAGAARVVLAVLARR